MLSLVFAALMIRTGLWGEVELDYGARIDARHRDSGQVFSDYVAEVSSKNCTDGSVNLLWKFTPDERADSEYLCFELDARDWKGGGIACDGKYFALPEEHIPSKAIHLDTGLAQRFVFTGPKGDERFAVEFAKPVNYHAMDCREWRLGNFAMRFSRPKTAEVFFCKISAPDGIDCKNSNQYVIKAGKDWIPLKETDSVAKGSAFDFSRLNDAPCGKYGRVVARGRHFEFEKLPGVRQRFYGPNVCTEAIVASPKTIDAFTDEMVKFGYNLIRFHHHDGELSRGNPDGSLNPAQLEKLDYFIDACRRKGLYVTTDLFVSRCVPWRSVGENRDGNIGMDEFKALVLTQEGAYSNLCAFARAWMTHRNPHSGMTWAEDPTLAMLAFVNEGHLDSSKPKEEWAELEMKFAARMSKFLREELGVKALLSDMSAGMEYEVYRPVRESSAYDYVDEHFYWNHPNWVKTPWRLPSVSENRNPVVFEEADVMSSASRVRVDNKPFVASEWDFTGPSVYRTLSGIVGASQMAREDWAAASRFCWAGSPWEMMYPSQVKAGFFTLAGDAFAKATEYAAVCLFLRGDGDEAIVNANRDTGEFTVVSKRTCGGFTENGEFAAGALAARGNNGAMTVWISSCDGAMIERATRLVLFHLTNLQNDGIAYRNRQCKEVLSWGNVPHLIRNGKAKISLALDSRSQYRFYALAADGSRLAEVPTKRLKNGRIVFVANVSAYPDTAVYAYEIVKGE